MTKTYILRLRNLTNGTLCAYTYTQTYTYTFTCREWTRCDADRRVSEEKRTKRIALQAMTGWSEREADSGEKSRISKQIADLALESPFPSCHLVTLAGRFYALRPFTRAPFYFLSHSPIVYILNSTLVTRLLRLPVTSRAQFSQLITRCCFKPINLHYALALITYNNVII